MDGTAERVRPALGRFRGKSRPERQGISASSLAAARCRTLEAATLSSAVAGLRYPTRAFFYAAGLTLLLAFQCLADVQAAQNKLIPFQGRVASAAGAALPDQTVAMTFAIYAQPEGQAEPLWSEVHPAVPGVPIKNGQINVLLGQITSLDDPAGNGSKPGVSFDQAPRYLGVTIGSGPGAQEMVPRHQLVPAFHARTAEVASAVVLNGVDANAIRPNAVTENKLGTDSVTRLKIKAGAVTGDRIADLAIDNTKLANDTIEEAKLSPALRALLDTLKTTVVPMLVDVSLDVPNAGGRAREFSPLAGQGIALKNRPTSNATARLACSAGVPAGATSCAPSDATVGVTFAAPRQANYEVCAQFLSGSYVESPANGQGDALQTQFELAETGKENFVVVSDTVSDVVEDSRAIHIGGPSVSVNYSARTPIRMCHIMRLAPGDHTIRLLYKWGSCLPNLPTCGSASVSGPVQLVVREIR